MLQTFGLFCTTFQLQGGTEFHNVQAYRAAPTQFFRPFEHKLEHGTCSLEARLQNVQDLGCVKLWVINKWSIFNTYHTQTIICRQNGYWS